MSLFEDQSQKIYQKNTRGTGGRTPWNVTFDASLTYAFQTGRIDWTTTLQVFNLLDIQEVTSINEHVEVDEGTANPLYGTAYGWQRPRYVRLSLQTRF